MMKHLKIRIRNGCGRVPPGPPSIENGAHDIEKLLLKTKVSEKAGCEA